MVRDDGTRGRILDAAVRLILTKGYEAMSINDVCQATGLTKGAVFHYVATKRSWASPLPPASPTGRLSFCERRLS